MKQVRPLFTIAAFLAAGCWVGAARGYAVYSEALEYDDYAVYSAAIRITNAEHQQALVVIALTCGFLCGSADCLFLIKDGNYWNLVRKERIWVS
jgi:hypothetical protein